MLKNLNKYSAAVKLSMEDFQEESPADETSTAVTDDGIAPTNAADTATADTDGTPVEPAGDDGTDIGTTPPADESGVPVVETPEATGAVTGDEPAMGSAVPGADLSVGDGIPNADQTTEGDLGGETTAAGAEAPAAPTEGTVEPELTNEVADSDDTFEMMDGMSGEGQDEATEGALEAENAAEAKLDDIEETNAALEMYAKQLKQAGLDGFSAQTAAVLHVGLQSCRRRLGLSDLNTGLEAYDATPRSAMRKAVVSLEDIRGTLAKGWETFIAWLKKLWELGKQTVDNIRSGITSLNLKISAVEKALTNAGESPVQGTDGVEVKNPYLLMDGRDLIYPQVGQFTAMATFAADVYPTEVAKYYTFIASAVAGFNPAADVAEEVVKRIEAKAAPVDHMFSGKMTLVGGYEVVAFPDGHGWKIEKDSASDDGDIESVTLVLRSKTKIQATLDKVKETVTKLEKVYSTQDDIAEAGDKIIKAIEKLKDRASKGELDQASKHEVDELATSAFGLVRGANPGHKSIVQYVVRGLNAYVAVLGREVGKLQTTFEEKND